VAAFEQVGRRHRDELLVEQRQRVRERLRAGDHADVGRPIVDPAFDLRIGAFEQHRGHARVRGFQRLQRRHDEGKRHARQRRDHQPAFELAARQRELLAQRMRVADDVLHVRPQAFAGSGQHDRLAVAQQQLDAGEVLELGQRVADRGLTAAEPLGRGRQRTEFDDGSQRLQLRKRHLVSLFRYVNCLHDTVDLHEPDRSGAAACARCPRGSGNMRRRAARCNSTARLDPTTRQHDNRVHARTRRQST
jgi:hypothetical protein